MKQSYPHISRTGSTVTIEARTMAEADAAAEAELGPGFTVASVRRLRRGGLGGFFALELVELVATTDDATAGAGGAADMASAEDLIRGLQRHDGDFATRLLDRIGDLDPDTVTVQELFTTARAAGIPADSLWEDVVDRSPAPTAVLTQRDERPEPERLDPVDRTPTWSTTELPIVADTAIPSPVAPEGHLAQRRPRTVDAPGPLAEMPPPPLRFDTEFGRWTVEDPAPDEPWIEDAAPAAIPLAPEPAPAPALEHPAAAEAPPAPAPVRSPRHAPPPPPAPAPPPPPVTATPAPAPPPPVTATPAPTPTWEAPPPPAGPGREHESAAPAGPTGPTLAEMGWRIDVDTPEPVVGEVDLGPIRPGPPAPVAVDALDALPEVTGPAVNTMPPADPHPPEHVDVVLPEVAPAEAPAATAEAVGTAADLEPAIFAPFDRTSPFRPAGLESLRSPRRSSGPWRPRPADEPAAIEPAAPNRLTPDPPTPVLVDEPVKIAEPVAEPVGPVGPVVAPPRAADHLPGTVAAFAPPPVRAAPVDDVPAPTPAPVAAAPAAASLTLGSLVPDAVPERPGTDPGLSGGWSPHALIALGLPDRLVRTAAALAPRDDAEWTAALMLALRPLFGPVPTAPTLLAGPLVEGVAEQLGASLVEPGERSGARIVALVTEDPAEVAATLDGRRLHLVVGGLWHELARLRPAVVSTAGPRFLLPAVTVAHAWGASLGVMAGVTAVRLDAVTVAMEIRATLGLDLDDPPAALNRPPFSRHPDEPAG